MAQAFSVPEESPAHHVRDLRICAGGQGRVNVFFFFEYTSESWFVNARRLTLLGRGGGDSAVPDVFALEVTTICNLFDYKVECLHSSVTLLDWVLLCCRVVVLGCARLANVQF